MGKLFFSGIFLLIIVSCQIYIPIFPTTTGFEKININYSILKNNIMNMAIDSDGNIYITDFYDYNFYGVSKYFAKRGDAGEKIYKIKPDATISEFTIYDNNGVLINIFPKGLFQHLKTDDPKIKENTFINYFPINFMIKDDYLYSSYDYGEPSNERGFLKLNLKNNYLQKFPREDINYTFDVTKKGEIFFKNKDQEIIKISTDNKDEVLLETEKTLSLTCNSSIYKLNADVYKETPDGKKETINLKPFYELPYFNLLYTSSDYVTDEKSNIYFIVTRRTLVSDYHFDLGAYYKSFDVSNYLYKLDSNNNVSILSRFIDPNVLGEFMLLDQKRNVIYFASKLKKDIYKIKL